MANKGRHGEAESWLFLSFLTWRRMELPATQGRQHYTFDAIYFGCSCVVRALRRQRSKKAWRPPTRCLSLKLDGGEMSSNLNDLHRTPLIWLHPQTPKPQYFQRKPTRRQVSINDWIPGQWWNGLENRLPRRYYLAMRGTPARALLLSYIVPVANSLLRKLCY